LLEPRRPRRGFSGTIFRHAEVVRTAFPWTTRAARRTLIAMEKRQVIVVGGGAAGYFAAIVCAEANPACAVTIYEATAHPLAKVRVSGGGRCNVTHACFEPRDLVKNYPRGSRELLGAFHRWQPRDMVEWFEKRGVALKTEADGRMFPVTDDSRTIVDCLQTAATKAGVIVLLNTGVKQVATKVGRVIGNAPDAHDESSGVLSNARGFTLTLTNGEIATGDHRGAGGILEGIGPAADYALGIERPGGFEIIGVGSACAA